MSNEILKRCCEKQAEERRLKIELLKRAQNVNNLFFTNKQKKDYPNATTFYTPETYASLISTTAELENQDISIQKGIAERNLLKFVGDTKTVNEMLSKLSDSEILLFNSYYNIFQTEARLNIKKAIAPDQFLDYLKKFLSKYSYTLSSQMRSSNVFNNTKQPYNSNISINEEEEGEEKDEDLINNYREEIAREIMNNPDLFELFTTTNISFELTGHNNLQDFLTVNPSINELKKVIKYINEYKNSGLRNINLLNKKIQKLCIDNPELYEYLEKNIYNITGYDTIDLFIENATLEEMNDMYDACKVLVKNIKKTNIKKTNIKTVKDLSHYNDNLKDITFRHDYKDYKSNIDLSDKYLYNTMKELNSYPDKSLIKRKAGRPPAIKPIGPIPPPKPVGRPSTKALSTSHRLMI